MNLRFVCKSSAQSNNSLNRSGNSLISIRKIGCCSAILPARLIRALGVTFLSNAMNTIFTLLLALIPAACPFQQFPALVGQSKENLSVSINDLRSAPTEVMLYGRSLSLSAYLWRDFMPKSHPHGESMIDGEPMIAVLKVGTSDKKPFPSGVRMDRAWVLFGEQMWEVSEFRAQVKDKDSWISCPD